MYRLFLILCFFLLSATSAANHFNVLALTASNYETIAELQQAAEAGDADAQANLGYLYYAGEGIEQNFSQAVYWYRKSATQGNKDAQYNLAVAYAFGEGVAQDVTEATIWYRRAAEQGHVISQYSLGISFLYGEGVEQDKNEAARWFKKAASGEYARAQVQLASMYHTGQGLRQDYRNAVKWYRRAADNGNAIAQYNLASLYRSGTGVEQNYLQAKFWYKKAADQGHIGAQNELTLIANAPPPQSAEETAPLFSVDKQELLTVDKNNLDIDATAPVDLSAPVVDIIDVPTPTPQATSDDSKLTRDNTVQELAAKPAAKATEKKGLLGFFSGLFTRDDDSAASTQSDSAPQENLALLVPDEAPLPKQIVDEEALTAEVIAPETALEELRALAIRGDSRAQYELAMLYHKGDMLEQDYAAAALWYRRAAEQGHTAAQQNLNALQAAIGIDTEAEGEVAIETSTDERVALVINNDTSAVISADEDYRQGIAYAYGEGVEQDVRTAFNLFYRAAERGHAAAQYKVAVAFAYGEGVRQSDQQATLWYRRAAEQDHLLAQRNLAQSYLDGVGVRQDKIQALAWYQIIANKGNIMDKHRHQQLQQQFTEGERLRSIELVKEITAQLSNGKAL